MNPDIKSVRDVLNVRTSDAFCSYGMGPNSREVVDYMRSVADVSSGVCIDSVQYEECKGKIEACRGPKDRRTDRLYSRVYCNYKEFPRSSRNLENTFFSCYNLCEDRGMFMLRGVDCKDEEFIYKLTQRRHLEKFWVLNHNARTFDIVVTKENHLHDG